MRAWRASVVAIAIALVPAGAMGQGAEERPLAWDVARGVLLDPTTYAPALIVHEGMERDWKTSQVLFAHGWVEQNPRFTLSGRSNDVPVPYAEGLARVRSAALRVLANSLINNAGVGVTERFLTARYPRHAKLIRTASWVERIAFASISAYRNSAAHFRQASTNRRLARENGYVAP